MNSLNSVIFEGTIRNSRRIEEDPVLVAFEVESTRYRKVPGKEEREAVITIIGCTYHKNFSGDLDGRGCRVVGRLERDSEGEVIILAEFMELKPNFKDQQTLL